MASSSNRPVCLLLALRLGVLRLGVLRLGVLRRGVLQLGVLRRGVLRRGVLQLGVLQLGVLQLGVLQLGCLQLDTVDDGATTRAMPNQPAAGAAGAMGGSGGSSSVPAVTVPSGAQRGFVLEGSFAYGLEGSVFLQCGTQEPWWVSFEGVALERFDEASLGFECDPSCLFVVKGTGELSGRGRYGQAGNYPRELTVTRVTRLERVSQSPNLFSLNELSCPR